MNPKSGESPSELAFPFTFCSALISLAMAGVQVSNLESKHIEHNGWDSRLGRHVPRTVLLLTFESLEKA